MGGDFGVLHVFLTVKAIDNALTRGTKEHSFLTTGAIADVSIAVVLNVAAAVAAEDRGGVQAWSPALAGTWCCIYS